MHKGRIEESGASRHLLLLLDLVSTKVNTQHDDASILGNAGGIVAGGSGMAMPASPCTGQEG